MRGGEPALLIPQLLVWRSQVARKARPDSKPNVESGWHVQEFLNWLLRLSSSQWRGNADSAHQNYTLTTLLLSGFGSEWLATVRLSYLRCGWVSYCVAQLASVWLMKWYHYGVPVKFYVIFSIPYLDHS